MVYEVKFEIAALVFVLFIYAYACICYPLKSKKNVLFRVMCLFLIVTETLDILSAYVISFTDFFPRYSNILVNTAYYMFGTALCYLLGVYIDLYIIPYNGKKLLSKFRKVILGIIELAIFLNMIWGYFFYVSSNNEYLHGEFFYVMHGVSLFFVAIAGITMLINIRKIDNVRKWYGALIILLYLLPMLIQVLFFPNTLLIMFGASLIMLVTFFSIETPDYVKLQDTLNKLEATKEELEHLNKKYYELAHFDQMTELLNRTAYEEKMISLKAKYEEIKASNEIILLIADLNFLKYLNDNMGHQIGDDAIIETAKNLKSSFTEKEYCYRIGGDEFCVISIGSSKEEFVKCYQSFLEAVEAHNKKVSYPYSVASAYHVIGDESLFDAMQDVDNKMYENKKEIKQKFPHLARK